MKETDNEQVAVALHKPLNLNLGLFINPDSMHLLPIRQSDGKYSYDMVKGGKIEKHIPTLYFFIHVLMERQNLGIEPLQCQYDPTFVQMFARDIEPFKSKNYFKFIWHTLRSIGVIEMKSLTQPNKYKKSAQAYFFKLMVPYLNYEVVQHNIRVSQRVKAKLDVLWNIDKHFSQTNNVPKFLNANIKHQLDSLQKINFDSNGATMYIRRLYSERKLSIVQYNSAMIAINNLRNGKINGTHSPECNRFYSTITSLSKELRQFIQDSQGNELIELDFASFNPFVLFKILNDRKLQCLTESERIQFENELDLYSRLLTSGDFYSAINELFFTDKNFTRDEIKQVVLWKWFNGRVNSKDKNRNVLLKKMTKISEIIDGLKAKRFEDFSNMTMKLESELVNDIIYPEFIRRHPNAVIYTIFDSYLTEKRFASELSELMINKGTEFFGIDCIVRQK